VSRLSEAAPDGHPPSDLGLAPLARPAPERPAARSQALGRWRSRLEPSAVFARVHAVLRHLVRLSRLELSHSRLRPPGRRACAYPARVRAPASTRLLLATHASTHRSPVLTNARPLPARPRRDPVHQPTPAHTRSMVTKDPPGRAVRRSPRAHASKLERATLGDLSAAPVQNISSQTRQEDDAPRRPELPM
jgi:hypothetical protein